MSYHNSKERNRRLKKLYNETKHSCMTGVWYDEQKGRYVRCSPHRGKNRKRLKKISSKKARRYKETIQNGNYKKVFDYQWMLY